jgi:Bacterial extracellular solute-binding proteins, family 5 Middle
MDNTPGNNNLQETFKKIRFQVYTIFKQSWPINWKHFQQSDLIIKAILGASTVAKTIIVGSLVGIILSVFLLFYGFYIVSTKEAPDNGGEVREAIIDSTMSVFNPVTSYASDAEQRVNSLLYHPLYKISYPDFLSDIKAEPVIKPVLLAKTPEWTEMNPEKPTENYKKLRFTLRKDIKWSNGKPITVNDVQYTFDLLKPTDSNPGGNLQFKDVFRQVRFNPIGEYEYELISDISNPQLIYEANFSPISKEYFSGLNIERLNNDGRSIKPLVTSGYFNFSEGNVQDPDSTKTSLIENPVKDSSNNFIKTVILSRNTVQNTSQPVYVDRYIMKTYYSLEDNSDNGSGSLEKAAKDGKIDILSRSISPSTSITPAKIKERLKLNQIIAPSNTFYSLFLNIKKDQYFINQTLRKYVICEFSRFNINAPLTDTIENLPRDRRLLPIQLQKSATADCPDDTSTILDSRFYSVTKGDDKKTVNLYGSPIELSLAGVEESGPVLDEIKNHFEAIGFRITNLIKNNTQLEDSIKNKTYNAIFLPITYTSNDPYSLFGTNGQNLTNISQNNKVQSYDVENNLKKLSSSNLTDESSKNKLIDFFSKEFVSINIFRGKAEVDYSERMAKSDIDISKKIPLVITLPTDVSVDLSQISFKTKRVKK